jgi:hypothetical protein
MKTRYKIRKEQLEMVVESFVMENKSRLRESEMITDEEGNIDEIFGFGKKITPEEAIKKGEEIVKKNKAKLGVYSMFAKNGDKEKSRKYLMYVGYNPDVKYSTWYDDKKAPDGTIGYFDESSTWSTQVGG